jgi:general secretion pathway protein H
MPENGRGFTLIELIVVLALAGLMFALVPPLFSGGIARAEVKAAARELAAALRFVRSYAVTRQQESVMTVDAQNRLYRISGRAQVKKLSQKIDITMITARSEQRSGKVASMRFYPDGSATGGQIRLRGGGQKYVVDVNWLTGRVAIYN